MTMILDDPTDLDKLGESPDMLGLRRQVESQLRTARLEAVKPLASDPLPAPTRSAGRASLGTHAQFVVDLSVTIEATSYAEAEERALLLPSQATTIHSIQKVQP